MAYMRRRRGICWYGASECIAATHQVKVTLNQNGYSKRPTQLRLPAYSPDFNPDEAIWAWARAAVTANTCLGTKAQVQEQMQRYFDGLSARTTEVQSRCRRKLQAVAEAVPVTSPKGRQTPYEDPIGASV